MYEQAALSVWHIDPIKIEEEWTDEFYNLMVNRYLERLEAEAEAYEEDDFKSRPKSLPNDGDSVPVNLKDFLTVHQYPKDKLMSSKEK